MPKPLPQTLGKEPLIEAVCELRLSPASPLHNVLPGFLFAKLPADQLGNLEQLPASMIPEPLRERDPNLAYASIVRLAWRDYYILVSARAVALACKMPYPKWPTFKSAALELFQLVLLSPFVKGVDRYSVKYVNFFPSADGKSGNTEMMDWTLKIGELPALGKSATQLRIEIPSPTGVVTALTIVSPAEVRRDGEPPKQGGIVDIDTICTHVTNDLKTFGNQLEKRLDDVRLINKQVFFDSLTEAAIGAMEPTYEEQQQLPTTLH